MLLPSHTLPSSLPLPTFPFLPNSYIPLYTPCNDHHHHHQNDKAALIEAAYAGQLELAKTLLDKKADVRAVDTVGYGYLFYPAISL
jgi:hypothetical protein